jgi:predicted DNA binding CopG/RHH family protein
MENKKEASSSLRIKDKVLRRVKIYVAEKGVTLLDFVSGVLSKEMDKQDKIKQKKSGLPF